MAVHNLTLDETHRIGIARLEPGDALLVTAPPAVAEIAAKPDRQWVAVSYDDFGVRPTFSAAPDHLAARYAGTGPLYQAIYSAAACIGTGAGPVAAIVFEARGSARNPRWTATGFEMSGRAAAGPVVGPVVGTVSPTEPDALGAWLRDLPLATILASRDGDAWQRWEGTETVYKEPDRVFPAVNSAMSFGTFELTEGHDALVALAAQAPFTILKLGHPATGTVTS